MGKQGKTGRDVCPFVRTVPGLTVDGKVFEPCFLKEVRFDDEVARGMLQQHR